MRTRVLLLALVAACGDDGAGSAIDANPDQPNPDATPAPYCEPRSGSNLRLQLITDAVTRPVAITAPPADPRLFIVEQAGTIRIVENGLLVATPFLAIDVEDTGDEQGLLGLAFHPDYAQNGRLFVLYTRPGTNNLRIAEYHATGNTAETAETVILDVNHGADNHNGGTVVFGPDGYLYASFGDGGAANDYFGMGQNPDARLAKVLRIDVDSGDPYGVPSSNPWATGGGVSEMFAWGLRNPWKISVDSANGDLWIGDVGQGLYEEIDVVRSGTSGQNFGWPVFEGPSCFTDDDSGNLNCDSPDAYDAPVMAYNRDGTGQCSVIAGGVYRGTCMPDFVGRFFFGDYCSGEVRSFPATEDTIAYSATTDHTDDVDPTGALYGRISSFGTDGYGELYVAALQSGDVYRIEVE